MKTLRNYRKTFYAFFAAGILSGSVLLTSCEKDNNDDNNNNTNSMYVISGSASGTQEVPSDSSAATATLTGTYNANTNSLMYTINWTGLSDSATVAHFHGPAEAGISANPLINLVITTNGINGTASGTVAVVDSVETALLAGKLYYNIHTLLYPNGEIRGQVSATVQ